MNKLKKGLLIAVPFILALASCGSNKITDVEIKDNYTKTINSGSFSLSDYTIVRTYSDGTTDEVTVDDSMVSDVERLKFYKTGHQKILVSYMGASLYLDITVVNDTFDGLSMEAQTFTYDGDEHSLSISGYYPKGTTITWPNGNNFTNAGTYTVIAILSYPGYDTITLNSQITIELGTYDMTNVSFDNSSYNYDKTSNTYTTVYDGEEKTFELSGELPSDVSVKYVMNGDAKNTATDAGTYNVTAKFTSKNNNYKSIPDLTSTFVIEKKEYVTDDFSVGKTNVVYNGSPYTWTLSTKLPSWMSAEYENNTYTDTGFYEMQVHLKITNDNYKFVVHDDENDTDYDSDEKTITFEVSIWEEEVEA